MNTIAQKVNKSNIPDELKELKQWVCWKYEERKNGKPTKPPYDPRVGRKVSANDPQNWLYFDEAWTFYEADECDGVGLALTENDPYAGIDLDNCRNAETGKIEGWAMKIVEKINSYAETSPSGTGLRIIVKVADKSLLPAAETEKIPSSNNGKVEFFTVKHYITLTGNHLEGTPTEIRERQAEVESFVQEYFGGVGIEQTTEELGDIPSDAEIAALLKVADQLIPDCHNLLYGDWPTERQNGLDRSGLEYLLARRLVEAGLCEVRTVATVLFGSGIHQAKAAGRSRAASWKLAWDCAVHALTEGTKPVSVTPENTADSLLSQVIPYERWVDEAPEAEPIWDGLLYRGAVHLLAAPAKRGKSRFLHDLLAHLTLPAVTLRVQQQEVPLLDGKYWNKEHLSGLKVLVITEESRSTWRRRNIPLGRVDFLPTYVAKRAGSEAIAEIVRRDLYDIVVIDTIDKVFQLKDENDNAAIVANIDPLVEATHESSTAVLLIHHHRKAGGSGGDEIRGGTALLGAVDVYLSFKAIQGQPRIREIEVQGRFDSPGAPIKAVLQDVRYGTYEPLSELEGPPQEEAKEAGSSKATNNSQTVILEYLKNASKPLSPADISTATGIKSDTVKKALKRLKERKEIVQVDHGLYSIPK
ncbi:hypothetical protein MTAT_14130 [Moorella thermoacetica]|uniref:Uncharacterized protein n=1 Tax=Neomoorella thermoacetica TaxID=1525 RepID=A0AAC9HHC5_NEOTH|nr:AAA family ATPase [Moorella thermoacetica]AOQ23828.1 hypothetical protein Maut_01380 [Moorella thermoacetica]TYL14013.1 hypothetical protein MTAT_14130 [Moorella thermoacetica]